MRFNWVDLLTIGVVSTVGAIQFLRATKDFSLVFYETALFIGALFASVKMLNPLHQLTNLSFGGCFVITFVILTILALLFASGLNRFFEFEFGMFNHFLGLFLGLAGGTVFGHAVLRTFILGYGATRPEVTEAIHRSWMATQVLYFGAFRELLAILRIARYNNI